MVATCLFGGVREREREREREGESGKVGIRTEGRKRWVRKIGAKMHKDRKGTDGKRDGGMEGN